MVVSLVFNPLIGFFFPNPILFCVPILNFGLETDTFST